MPSVSWAVNADGDWSTVADWSPAGMPNATDDVTINTANLHTVTHGAGTDTVNSLTVGNDDFVMSGGSLSVATSASFANLLTISGATMKLGAGVSTISSLDENNGTLSAKGTLTVTGPAVLTGASEINAVGVASILGPTTIASGARILLQSSTSFTLSGTGTTVAGLIDGPTQLFFSGGSVALNNGASINTTLWTIDGGATVSLGKILTYERTFTQNGSTIELGGYTLNLGGSATFNGAKVDGPGDLNLSSAFLNGLTLDGGATLNNVHSTTQNGKIVLGGKSKIINTNAYYITAGVGITANGTGSSFVNEGMLEKTGSGVSKITVLVKNSRDIVVLGGTLSLGTVTGSGVALLYGGTLAVAGPGFVENVSFSGTGTTFRLGHSTSYTGTVSGFSTSGGTSLDLRDIGFVSSTEATFSGTSGGGVLTVTDGTHTANIKLAGDYLGSTFTASSDGLGGTIVVDPARNSASPHGFVAAMAALAAPAGGAVHAGEPGAIHAPLFARPHTMTA